MIKIAICDDVEKELNKTRDMCNIYRISHPQYDIKLSFFISPMDLLQCIVYRERYDIIFLDIYMPDITGIELAREIRMLDDECQMIFLTSSSAHAVEAFSVHAAHYLVKPYTIKQLEDALDKAITATEKLGKAFVILKIPGGITKINFKDFIYAETERHNQKLHLGNNMTQSVRMSSIEMFQLLSFDHRFYKCGSTYIINLDKVEEINSRYIAFENEEKLPMQRRHYKEMLKQYTYYSLEGM